MDILLYFVLCLDLFVLALIIIDLVKRKDISKTNPLIYLLIVICIYSLYFYGQKPLSGDLLGIIIASFSATRDLIVFKINYALVSEMIHSSPVFAIAYFLTILITFYYILRLIIHLFFKRINNYFKIKALIKKPVVVVIGDNIEGQKFIQANPKKVILWDKHSTNTSVPFFRKDLTSDNFKYLSKYKTVEFVTFTSQEESLSLANTFFLSLSEDDFVSSNIFLTIVIEQDFSQVYEALIEKGRGVIRIINKYDVIAKELIKHHPFSKYLDETFLESNGLLKPDYEIQGVFIGYGKVNAEVYLKCVMNNQFATYQNKQMLAKAVNYHIIEKEQKQYNKKINHTFLRYETSVFNEDEYLPLPEPIQQTTYHQLDINSKAFYEHLEKIFQKEKSATFVFVSIDSDLENLDIILKLKEYINYHNFKHIKLFVRIEDYEAIKDLFTIDTSLADIVLFGTYEEYINEEVLFDRSLEKAAIKTAQKYEESRSAKVKQPTFIKPRHNWNSLSIYKQDSNRYAILSLNFKLNLLGYNLFDKGLESVPLAEFYQFYDPTNERERVNERLSYQLLAPFQTRDVLAFLEHLRWNAFHICHGYIPLKKEFITLASNKDMKLKLHGCLTTFNGLDLYHEHLIKQIKDKSLSSDEKYLKVDVKKYDYLLIDDLENNLKELNLNLYKKS